MQIITALNIGFCFGVERAIRIAKEEAKLRGCVVYTYGALIHNADVIRELEEEGIRAAESLEDIPDGSPVILRSHGVTPQEIQRCRDKSLLVTDATCPFVKKIHGIVSEYCEKGYQIVIFGSADHPEVKGIGGWCGSALVVGSAAEAQALPFAQKRCLVSQTTASYEVFLDVIDILRQNAGEFVYFNTICETTATRQQEAENLSKKCTKMIVVGGRHSSNTQKLVQVCRRHCKYVVSITKDCELSLENIATNDIIGVVGGASTPIWIIMEVITRMSELEKTMAESPEVEKVEAKAAATVEEPITENAHTAAKEAPEPSFEDVFEKTLVRIKNGQIIKGSVVQIVDGEVCVNIGYKSDGFIPRNEFSADTDVNPADVVKVGDEIEVEVIKVNDGEGNVLLSHKNVESKKLWDDLMQDEAIQDKVFAGIGKEVVKGGLIATINGIRAFVPASQLSTKYVENIGDFVGKEIDLKVIEVDKSRKRIVASHKAVMLLEAESAKKELWAKLEVGSKVNGIVRRLTDFGAFVDIGGIDGLVHVTDVAWGRVKHPSDVLAIGQEIEVLIRDVDVEKQRVSLGYKQLQPKPWTMANEKYPVGSIVEGRVVRIVPFGAFVALEPTIDGLIHISQVGVRRIEKVEDEVNVGDIVRCKVLDVNTEAKRISLSRREVILEENPEVAQELAKEKADREQQAAERAAERAAAAETARASQSQSQSQSHSQSHYQSQSQDSSYAERAEKRRTRREESDYQLPPVQSATTSLADLFSSFNSAETEEEN